MRYLVVMITLLGIFPGCAVFNRENTRALNFVENHLVPSDPLTKKLTYPLTIPVSTVAVTFDALIIHPLTTLPEAADDMKEWAWKNMDWEEHYFTTSASVVPRAVFMPLAFTGSFMGRSLFDVGQRKVQQKPEAEEEKRLIKEARQALRAQRQDDALALAQKILEKTPYQPDAQEIRTSALLDKGDIHQLVSQRVAVRWGDEIENKYVRALVSASSVDRIKLLSMVERGMFHSIRADDALLHGLVTVLSDNDRAVRMKILAVIGKYLSVASYRAVLEKIATGTDQVLAAEAQMRLPN